MIKNLLLTLVLVLSLGGMAVHNSNTMNSEAETIYTDEEIAMSYAINEIECADNCSVEIIDDTDDEYIRFMVYENETPVRYASIRRSYGIQQLERANN